MLVETKNERQENAITMYPPKCDAVDYIQFLIAAQRVFTCTEAARCQPPGANAPAHDAFTRLLHAAQPSDTEALWRDAEGLVDKRSGFLVLDACLTAGMRPWRI